MSVLSFSKIRKKNAALKITDVSWIRCPFARRRMSDPAPLGDWLLTVFLSATNSAGFYRLIALMLMVYALCSPICITVCHAISSATLFLVLWALQVSFQSTFFVANWAKRPQHDSREAFAIFDVRFKNRFEQGKHHPCPPTQMYSMSHFRPDLDICFPALYKNLSDIKITDNLQIIRV